MKPTISPDKDIEISKLYASGYTIAEICNLFILKEKTVRNSLKRTETPRRASKPRGTPFDEHAFDAITDDSAYWVGMLMADGCIRIYPSGAHVVSLTLEASDIAHLEKLNAFLKTTKPIFHRPPITTTKGIKIREQCEVQFNSRHMVERLSEYGVTPKKSFTATPAECLMYNRHFWRGVIDGDGHVSIPKTKLPIIHLSGSENVVTGFARFIKSVEPNCPTNPRPYNNNRRTYQMAFQGRWAVPILNALYSDCSTYLQRKMDRYNEIVSCICPCCQSWSREKATEFYSLHHHIMSE